MFSEATNAYKNNNIGKLIEIAAKTKIEIPNIGEESIYILENNIKEVEKEIKSKKQTTAWGWYRAKTEKQKKEIAKAILKSRGVTNG